MFDFMKYLNQLFDYLGLSEKKGKLLFLGLDNAGKTTLMHKMVTGKLGNFKPTSQPTQETFRIGGVTVRAFDLGGHKEARQLWEQYFTRVDGIVFLVDAAEHDPSRVATSRRILEEILRSEVLSRVPILVLGNKIDMPEARSEEMLLDVLGVSELCTGKKVGTSTVKSQTRPFEVFMCSVVKEVGYPTGIRWLAQHLEDA